MRCTFHPTRDRNLYPFADGDLRFADGSLICTMRSRFQAGKRPKIELTGEEEGVFVETLVGSQTLNVWVSEA